MKRTAIAIVLALAALGLLISLALESRPMPVEVHVAQYTIASDLERINDDFKTLVTTLEDSWNETQAPGEAARALLARIATQPQQLPRSLFELRGNASQEQRLQNSFDSFTKTIQDSATLAGELLKFVMAHGVVELSVICLAGAAGSAYSGCAPGASASA